MKELIQPTITFDGARNHDVVKWLQFIEEAFDRERLEASHNYVAVSHFLTGDAAIWFKHNNSSIRDWFTFKHETVEFFSSSSSSRRRDRYQLTVKEELQTLEQKQDILGVPTSSLTMSHNGLDDGNASSDSINDNRNNSFEDLESKQLCEPEQDHCSHMLINVIDPDLKIQPPRAEVITQFDKNSENSDRSATMQSKALMKERRRTIAWHPQHVAYYRSYHDRKSTSIGPTINFSSPPSSLFELDPVEAPWPNNTELWHIHEIRSQRKSFMNRIDPELLIIAQETSVERENQSVERVLQLDRNLSEPASKVDQISILPSQRTIHLPDLVNVDTRLRELQRIPETKSISNVLNLKQQDPCTLTLNDLVDGSLLPSYFVSKLQPRDQCRNRLLRLIGLRFGFLLSCLFTVLIRFGMVYPLLTNRFDEVATQSSTFESVFIINTLSAIYSQHLKHSTPFVKTIETLRKLETLLIYSIT